MLQIDAPLSKISGYATALLSRRVCCCGRRRRDRNINQLLHGRRAAAGELQQIPLT